MKRYSSRDGVRIWYSDREIEERVEEALLQSGLMPKMPNPVTDLERFIEKHLDAKLEEWVELDADILGATDFGLQPITVFINRRLTDRVEAPGCPLWLKGRRRATLAHEASHILLHEPLFPRRPPDQGELFPVEPHIDPPPRHHCRLHDIEPPAANPHNWDWREVQANKGMATLLMPRRLFVEAARQVRQVRGIDLADVVVGSSAHRQVVGDLSVLFEVSKQACEIRLSTVGLVHDEHRPLLPFE